MNARRLNDPKTAPLVPVYFFIDNTRDRSAITITGWDRGADKILEYRFTSSGADQREMVVRPLTADDAEWLKNIGARPTAEAAADALRVAAEAIINPDNIRESTESGWLLVRRDALAELDNVLNPGAEDENPRYGPGNPDWERDFDRTRE